MFKSLAILALCVAASLAPICAAPTPQQADGPTLSETDRSLINQSGPQTQPEPVTATTSKPDSSASTELPDFTSFRNTSTFTCYGRVTGYYADVRLACRVYHFCTQLDGIGETTYQRMSYICLDGSVFDQRDLNCVVEADLKVSCDKAEAEYNSSNKQFDNKEESAPSMSDSLAANIMMNPVTRFLVGR